MPRPGPRNLAAVGAAALVIGLIALLPHWPVLPDGVRTVWPLAVVAAALFWAIDRYLATSHRRAQEHFASLHGWTYARETQEYLYRFGSFPFATGTTPRQKDVLSGQLNGVQSATFTHHFNSDSRAKAFADQAFQITLVELPVLLPKLELVPESVAAKFAKALGGTDLDVESYEFNRRWRVLCRDPRYAHAVLDPRMVERLLQPDALELAIRIEGGAVMAWQPGRVGTDTLARRLGVLTAVARRIPEHVVREYRERGAHNMPAGEPPIAPTAPAWATTPGALTSGKATGVEPGPPATGEGYRGLPDGREGFDIFDAMTFGWQ